MISYRLTILILLVLHLLSLVVIAQNENDNHAPDMNWVPVAVVELEYVMHGLVSTCITARAFHHSFARGRCTSLFRIAFHR